MLTPFGYSVDVLPPIIDLDTFHALTDGLYTDDERAEAALASASALVRMACRWHIAPNLECDYTTTANGRIIQLPALAVTNVRAVLEGDRELSAGEYEWRREGILRRACFRNWSPKWDGVRVMYSAGFDAVPEDVAKVVINKAVGGLSMPVGVRSESTDGVSISYIDQFVTGTLTAYDTLALSTYALPTEI